MSTAAAMVAALLAAMSAPAAAAGASPDAYVLQADGATAVDTSRRSVVEGLAGLAAPTDLTFAPDGSRGYATSHSQDQVFVVDPATNAVLTTIPTGDGPSSVAVSPDSARLYVMLAAGVVEVLDVATAAPVASIDVGAVGPLAISPDGATGYVAAGSVHELDLATATVTASYPVGATVRADGIVLSPNGTRAYVTASGTLGGTLVIVDLATRTVLAEPGFGSFAGQMAITPDGRRVLVAVEASFVDTGYGAGFMPGRTVRVLDTTTRAWVGHVDLGAAGSAWFEQNTASGLAVTPDGGSVYIGVPRTDEVAVADIVTLAVTETVPVLDPAVIGMESDPDAAPAPRVVTAAGDHGSVTTAGGDAVADVLANDRVGGLVATPDRVTLSQLSSTDPSVALDADAAVRVTSGGPIGTQELAYRICDVTDQTSCSTATVTVNVRAPAVVDATGDVGSAFAGGTAVRDVRSNDTIDAAVPTTGTTRLSQLATTDSGVRLDPTTGAVSVAPGTQGADHVLRYRLCAVEAPSGDCDEANVQVGVLTHAIDAVEDSGSTTRRGGVAVADVLANDTVDGAGALASALTVSQTSSTDPWISLDVATRSVQVTRDAPIGTYQFGYRVCERADASNCDTATVRVTVRPYVLTAVGDAGRGSSKVANTVVADVLANDRLGSVRATLATVRLAQVSSTNPQVVLRPASGAVAVTGKTSSGLVRLVYRACERALLTNCDRASVTVDLSGGG